MAKKTSKFIFTKEGRTLLVSQTGGIKFAILGYMLVEGLAGNADNPNACCDSLEERWAEIEQLANNQNMTTIEYLTTQQTGMTFLMNNVQYEYVSDYYVKPINITKYKQALADYKHNLFGTFYIPSTEIGSVNEEGDGNRYGTYAFNFDRTYLNCEVPKDRGYQVRHIVLIGKQYAENNEATFNVNLRQDASIVGVAEIVQESESDEGPGIQILPNQHEFVSFQCQLRFTVVTCEYDDVSPQLRDIEFVIDDNSEVPVYEPVTDIASKLALVNNGVKTLSGGITIGQNKEILDELQLGPDGAICMTKTLTVADCIDADDAENQFNAAALIHPINKYPSDGGEYIPQILMTTVHATSALNEELTAYSVGMTVKAEGIGDPYKIADGETYAVGAPVFKLGHVPENDFINVDIFGLDNIYNGYVSDRYMFSNNNSATDPAYNNPNVIIDSDGNAFTRGAAQNNNALYSSINNRLTMGTNSTLLFGSKYNELSGDSGSIYILSDANKSINGGDNRIVCSDNNILRNYSNTLIDSDSNSAIGNANVFSLYTSNDNYIAGNAYKNTLIKSDYNTYSGTTTNSLLINSVRNEMYEDTKNLMGIGVKDCTFSGAYEDALLNSRGSTMIKSYFNGFMDNVHCMAVSSEQNTIVRSRYTGVKGLPLGSIDSGERPILADVQSNNNIILGGEYFDLFGSSNNLIMDSYKLQSDDSNASYGPVRVKGSTIINSSKSKIYNAREVHILNSEYTRVHAVSNYDDAVLGLAGTSRALASTEELDSIYYGEFYTNNDYYAYYGLKGTSYKTGAETLTSDSRPADMLKLKMMFVNSFGSELNLADYYPASRQAHFVAYNPNAAFASQNATLMTPSVRPTNSNIIGGHHNKMVGGKNVVILGGEYCKASTYSHQVIMGKFNRDVPADLIFGCGHFNGTSYVQGTRTYSERELEGIETMSTTIADVRGDAGDINGTTCYNALEFYAHQGKMILQDCNDGHDSGTNTRSSWFGSSVTIAPSGIVFRDSDGEITGQVNPMANTEDVTWTFIISRDSAGYYVSDYVNIPSYLSSMDKHALFNLFMFEIDWSKYSWPTGTNPSEAILPSDAVYTKNATLFNSGKNIPSEINIIFTNIRDTGGSAPGSPKNGQFECVLLTYPWLTTEGNAPRYLKNNKFIVNVYKPAPCRASSGNARWLGVSYVPGAIDSKGLCMNMEINTYLHGDQYSNENLFWINNNERGAIKFVSINSNKYYSGLVVESMANIAPYDKAPKYKSSST